MKLILFVKKLYEMTLAQNLLNFCKKKGIKSDPLPDEYIKAGWFLVPLKHVKEVQKESLKYQ